MTITEYSEHELGEIQDMISGKRQLSDSEKETIRNNVRAHPGRHMLPFLGLYLTNPELYKKLSGDSLVSEYSLFGFFPEAFGLVYGSEVLPETFVDGGNRGLVAIIKHPMKNIVIKPVQSSREQEIARASDELGVGPRQLPILDHYITEEFVEGEHFSRLRGERASEEEMYKIGKRVGEILTKLHSKGIYYNDTILSDDMGRSHVIVPENTPAILFDYGVALNVNKHPDFSDEEVFDFARTIPGVNIFSGDSPNKEQIEMLVNDFRPKIKELTKEHILDRDFHFIHEGIWFARSRIGDSMAQPFLRGFNESYKR